MANSPNPTQLTNNPPSDDASMSRAEECEQRLEDLNLEAGSPMAVEADSDAPDSDADEMMDDAEARVKEAGIQLNLGVWQAFVGSAAGYTVESFPGEGYQETDVNMAEDEGAEHDGNGAQTAGNRDSPMEVERFDVDESDDVEMPGPPANSPADP